MVGVNYVEMIHVYHSGAFYLHTYICLRACQTLLKTSKIYFHTDTLPTGEWWDKLQAVEAIQDSAQVTKISSTNNILHMPSDMLFRQALKSNNEFSSISLDTDGTCEHFFHALLELSCDCICLCAQRNLQQLLEFDYAKILEFDSCYTLEARKYLDPPVFNNLTVVTPFRADSVERLENLLVVMDYLKTRLYLTNLLLIESDTEPKIAPLLKNHIGAFKYVFVQAQEYWSRSRLFNSALPCIDTPYCAYWDADVIIPLGTLIEAYKRIETEDIILPHSVVYHVKRQYLEGVKNKQTNYKYLADPEKCARVFNDPHGGVTICKTAAVRYVRGFNELFWSWGGEDTEFVMRTVKLGLKVVRIKSPLIHFHHTRTNNCFPSKKFALLSQLEQDHIIAWSPARIKQYMGLADVGDYTNLTHPRVYEDDQELIKKAEEKLEPYKHLFT